MKNYSKTNKSIFKTLSIFLAVLAFSFTTNASAQGNADGPSTGATGVTVTTGTNSTGGNCGNGPHTHAGNAICSNKGGGGTSVPLDGGLGFLLVGAAAFGVKKLRDNKNGTI